MPDIISDDRATEIVAMTVPDLTAALVGLDLPSLELVLHTEEQKGDAVRATAIAAITAAIAALATSDPAPVVVQPRYIPPTDPTGTIFSTGRELSVDADGFIELPDDLTTDEMRQLIVTGFVPALT